MALPVALVNIGQLATLSGPPRPRAGAEMRSLGLLKDAAVLMQDGVIVEAGLRDLVLRHPAAHKARILDAGGRLVLPGFVDSHAHPVFAAPRLADFQSRLSGKTYKDIAAEGGGILSSVRALRAASEDELTGRLSTWASRFIECGTTTLEAKSGYGLDADNELKILRAVKRAAEVCSLELVPTLLGAHAVPEEHEGRPEEYARVVCEEMVPRAAKDGLARFIDVFCEEGCFSEALAAQVLEAGARAGLKLKVHAEQLSRSGGSRLAARLKAVSADHLDQASDEDFRALREAGVVATFLPAANYFLGLPPPPARRAIEQGVAVALATDFNPGTAPCWNMATVLSIAATQARMTPEEVLVASTINGAWALGLAERLGSIEKGKQADLVVFDAEDYREVPYWFGSTLAVITLKKGAIAHSTLNPRP